MSALGTEPEPNARFPGLAGAGSQTDSDLPKRDAAIILSVTALIVGLIVLFLVTAPTFARPAHEHGSIEPAPTESLPAFHQEIPQENDHAASRD